MKIKLTSAVFAISSVVCHAAMETWTNQDGRKADMELKKVMTEGDVTTAEFLTKSGQTVKLKSTELSTESKARISLWKSVPAGISEAPASSSPVTAVASVFDGVIEGNLEKIAGKTVKRYSPESKPSKFYVFYYSASWCGPCHQYTPSLVTLYQKLKPRKNEFELVMITGDDNQKAMESYMVETKMPWPALKLEKAEKFKSKFHHEVTGIPCVVICNLDGTVVAKTQDLGMIERIITVKN
jgi:nucleoredoxin